MFNTKKLTTCLLTVLLFGIWPLSVATNVANAWQDDPFGTDDPDFQIVASDTAPVADNSDLDQSLSDGVRLIIQSVRDSNPSSPVELARAIKSMMNIKQLNEAKRYLDILIQSNPNGPQLFELNRTMGPDFLLEIRSQPELQPAASEFAEMVMRTAKSEAFSPDRINELITELSDDNRIVRQDAFRNLRLLGAPAVAVMLNVCEDQKRRKEVPFVQSALTRMGKPAILPLIGAVRADGTVAQAVAVGALSNIQMNLATDALLRPSISSRVPESVRSIAADAIAQRGLNSQYEIEQRLFERANEYLDGKVSIPVGENGQVQVWNWNFAQKKLISTIISAENASRIMSVDLARDIYQLNPADFNYRQLQLLTVLEATKRVIGPNRFILQDEVSQFIADVRATDVDLALKNAIDRDLLPAATAAAELAGQLGDVSLVMSADGMPSNLVNAILSGHRGLQFAAAKAIATIDPQQAFPGCSYVAKIISLMANTDGQSAVIVAHPNVEVAQSVASSIFQSGSVGLTVNSSVELFNQLNSNPDVDYVLITDALTRPYYHEVIQQIREYWLTQNIPVGLLVRDDRRGRQAEQVLGNDPLTLILPITADPKFMYGQIVRLSHLRPMKSVSKVQRDLHANFALEWINKTLEQPETYRFYHLTSYRDQLVQLFKTPGLPELKCGILSKLGTPDSQRTLLNLASDEGLPIGERELFATAFAEAVNRRGIQLTRAEIQTQYDRYNASSRQPIESQKILGSILDAIESKTLPEKSVFSRASTR